MDKAEKKRIEDIENCEICGCHIHRTKGTYAKQTPQGRSHATKHHYVAKRFARIFVNGRKNPWEKEEKLGVFCYECHEELLHNPVLLRRDIDLLREIVAKKKVSKTTKPKCLRGDNLLERIKVFHEIIELGLQTYLKLNKHG